MKDKNEKNWLIRTRSKQILGPVSKSKIKEFVERESLQPDDEISRGNGYWFLIKERELLDKYVFGDVPQEFNPISEALSVVVREERPETTASFTPTRSNMNSREDDNGEKVPKKESLEYPDIDDGTTQLPESDDRAPDTTQMIKIPKEMSSTNIPVVEFDDSPFNDGDGKVPDEQDLAYPDMDPDIEEVEAADNSSAKKKLAENISIVENMVVPPSQRTTISPNSHQKMDNLIKKVVLSDEEGNEEYQGEKIKEKTRFISKNRNDRYLHVLLLLVVAILVAVVYYYKKILNKPLPLIGLVTSEAFAQVPGEKILKKKSFTTFEKLEIDGIEFSPVVDIFGFHLRPGQSNPPESCASLERFGVKLFLILGGRDLPKEWKAYRDKCSFKISGEFGALMDEVEFKRETSLESFLKPYKLEKRKNNFIQKVHYQIKKDVLSENGVSLFLNFMEEEMDLKSNKKVDLLQNYLQKVKGVDNIFSSLTRLAIALEWQNFSWAKREIKNLIHIDPIRYIYSIQSRYLENPKARERMIESLKLIVQRAFEVEELKEEVRIMVSNFSLIMDAREIKKIVEKVGANWSLVDLRKLSVKGRRGREYFEFWYSSLKGRTTQNEIYNYFKRSINPTVIKEMPRHALWVFAEYLPKDSTERKIIIERAIQMGSSRDDYDNLIALRLISHEPLKKEVVKKVSWLRGARFNVQRNFYRKSLSNGRAIHFNIYNLLRLGDKDENFFWWLVL